MGLVVVNEDERVVDGVDEMDVVRDVVVCVVGGQKISLPAQHGFDESISHDSSQ